MSYHLFFQKETHINLANKFSLQLLRLGNIKEKYFKISIYTDKDKDIRFSFPFQIERRVPKFSFIKVIFCLFAHLRENLESSDKT